MRTYFRFTMPGQPPSWNHAYRWGTRRVPGGKNVRIQVKTDETNLFQANMTMLCRVARPSSFNPEGQVIVAYRMSLLKLGRELDADNVLKLSNDAISKALDINDNRFLPVVLSKTIVPKDPQLEIAIYDGNCWSTELRLL